MNYPKEISTVIEAFLPNIQIDGIQHLEIGHINPTYIVRYHVDASHGALFVQQLNAHVFREPESVIHNIQRVTGHLRKKLAKARQQDLDRRALQLIRTAEGQPFKIDPSGRLWRAYRYIEDAYSINTVETAHQARAAAYAFGEFTRLLADLPAPPLIETIENFHDTRWRFEEFMKAVAQNPLKRVAGAIREIDFARSRETTTQALVEWQDGDLLPLRSVHNDTKINNILFDANTHEALCVVDLDTVMPGQVAHDFGDLVRSGIGDHAEDETDLTQIHLRMPIFTALAQGYLAGTRGLLSDAENESLLIGARVITLELGLRFLTDYLLGDLYFTVRGAYQNLQRARVQFRLLELMEHNEGEMRAVIERTRAKGLIRK
jgi:hypothetical protein